MPSVHMNTKKHEVIAAELIAGKQGGIRLLELLRSKACGAYTFYREGEMAVLSVINEGRTVSLLTSIPERSADSDTLQSLLKHAITALSSQSLTLAQIVLNEPVPPLQIHAITEAGFEELAKLNYLKRQATIPMPRVSNKPEVHFESMETLNDVALGKVLEDTYVGSLDCPSLHGVRPIQDIIDGHRMSTPYQPAYWFIGTIDESPACVLLLNPKDGDLELAYVGVIPSQRGRGIADCCLTKTIQLAQHHDFQRITLVVDKANVNAGELYAKWGFTKTQSRHAFMHKLC